MFRQRDLQGDVSRDGWNGIIYLFLGAPTKQATRSNSSGGGLAGDISFLIH